MQTSGGVSRSGRQNDADVEDARDIEDARTPQLARAHGRCTRGAVKFWRVGCWSRREDDAARIAPGRVGRKVTAIVDTWGVSDR
jgi:hypothetical protein